MKMSKKYKYLLKNTLLFLVAGFIPKSISFFLVPLYTYCLTTSDYGMAELLTNTVQLLLPILTLQVQDAVLRFSMEKKEIQKDVLGIGIGLTVKAIGIFSVGVILVKILGIFDWDWIYFAYLVLYFALSGLGNIITYFCRGIDKIRSITIGTILLTIITVGCNLVFLLVFHWGIEGYLIAGIIGQFCSNIYIWLDAKLFSYIKIRNINKQIKSQMISFSIPMIFSALAWWVNNASDKYFLTYLSGVSIVGIYSVSSKIPTILSTLGTVVSKAHSISAIKELDKEDSDGFLGMSYEMISIATVLLCSIVLILNIPLSSFLYLQDFSEAWRYVPFLLFSTLMNQLSLSCENMFIALKHTRIVSATAVMAALINTTLNIFLIPYFEAYGAAIATVIGFTFQWGLRYFNLSKEIKMKHSFKHEMISYIILFFQMLLACWGNRFIGVQIICLGCLAFVYRDKLWNIAKLSLLKRR